MYGANEIAVDGDPRTDVRYVRITDIDDHGYLREDGWKTAKKVEKKYALGRNDLLFARTGTVGKTFIHKREDGEAIFAGYLIRFRFDETRINPHFVFYYTLLSRYRLWVQTIQRPSVQPNINSKEFKAFEIPLPPPSIQNHIVTIMKSAYAKKKQKEQEADTLLDSIDDYVLKELRIEMPEAEEKKCFVVYANETVGRRVDSFYYQSKFRNVDQIMENVQFDVFNLGALIGEISSGATPKVDENYYTDSPMGIPFLRVQNVTSHGIDLRDAKFITPEVHNGMLKRSQLKKDDLVFTITGRIGSVAVVPDNFEGNINQHSVRFHLKDQITNITINPNYVEAFLNSELGKSLSIREVTGGTRPALDYKAIKSLKIILPPIEIQNEIVAEIKNRLAKVAEFRSEANAIVGQAKERVERILLAEE